MLFNSQEFLLYFLPIVLAGYGLLRDRGRLLWLTLASYFFYGWWDWRFTFLMLASTVVDYVCGGRIHSSGEPGARRRWLAASMAANLALLGFFKYAGLFTRTLNALAEALASRPLLPPIEIVLPVGISFYTFQSMSYSIDIYRRQARPAPSFVAFACYVSLFPQLVAGPIVRYATISEQLTCRTHTWTKAARGLFLLVIGLSKKCILADGVAPLAETVFDGAPCGAAVAWVGVLAYAMQIYFDFSGYSDMAMGLGLLLGFRFPRNFDAPYQARSMQEFWRRWHITLSTWLRDYLYLPLGGSRRGAARNCANLFITMLLGGLWHGANWTFVAWGAYHGLLLAGERACGVNAREYGRGGRAARRGATFLLVLLGWVLFRSPTFARAAEIFAAMAGGAGGGLDQLRALAGARAGALTILAGAAGFAWLAPGAWAEQARLGLVAGIACAALFLVCVYLIATGAYSPFLYFQF